MNILSMILRILAILGAIAAVALFFIIGDQLKDTRTDLEQSETRLNSTQDDLRTVRGERDELEEEVNELDTNLENAENEISSLRNELSEVRRELEQASQVISRREEEAEELRSEATRIRRDLLEEQRRIASLEQEMDEEDAAAMRRHIRELEQQLEETERRMREVSEDDEQRPTEQTTTESAPIFRTEVLEVSSDRAFVLIGAGASDGVSSGQRVLIRRGGRVLGEARISEVEDDVSVAYLRDGSGRIQPGDLVMSISR